jgi:CRP-like cAMP-binding protein
MNADDLWLKDQPDDLADLATGRIEQAEADASRHIGCPLSWFTLVFPVVRGKSELAVALCLYRLRAVQRSRTVTVSNVGLLAELGIDRFAKYRALRRLAEAGIITVKRCGKSSLKIEFAKRPKRPN